MEFRDLYAQQDNFSIKKIFSQFNHFKIKWKAGTCCSFSQEKMSIQCNEINLCSFLIFLQSFNLFVVFKCLYSFNLFIVFCSPFKTEMNFNQSMFMPLHNFLFFSFNLNFISFIYLNYFFILLLFNICCSKLFFYKLYILYIIYLPN